MAEIHIYPDDDEHVVVHRDDPNDRIASGCVPLIVLLVIISVICMVVDAISACLKFLVTWGPIAVPLLLSVAALFVFYKVLSKRKE